MSNDEPELSVDEFVDYCRTQSGLLSGSIQTMGEEAEAVLDEIDAAIGELGDRIDKATEAETQSTAAEITTEGDGSMTATELEESITQKQLVVEAKQARMQAFQDLAAGYESLADEIEEGVEEGSAALDRVVTFESDNVAPAYFQDRQTVLEAAASSDGASRP